MILYTWSWNGHKEHILQRKTEYSRVSFLYEICSSPDGSLLFTLRIRLGDWNVTCLSCRMQHGLCCFYLVTRVVSNSATSDTLCNSVTVMQEQDGTYKAFNHERYIQYQSQLCNRRQPCSSRRGFSAGILSMPKTIGRSEDMMPIPIVQSQIRPFPQHDSLL